MSVSPGARLGLRAVALLYLAALLLVPVGLVLYRTFEPGLGAVWESITTPAAIHAFYLTLLVTAIAVPLNAIFGIVTALALVRGRFRGKALLRSEEHTSELQSRQYLVCRLLLEKKNTTT